MRRVFAGLLALCACDYSNEDLEFKFALPKREQLRVELSAATMRQPLSIGEPSKTYDDVKEKAARLDEAVGEVIAGLDFMREIAPTRRDESRSISTSLIDARRMDSFISISTTPSNPGRSMTPGP